MDASTPIGFFDSGYGGLTILNHVRRLLPRYDYLYLGDNARAPYGNRSFDLVYRFTLEAVEKLFDRGCPLVILACNTASAKALRTIQQTVLPARYPGRRVLGVIRPTVESMSSFTTTGHVGVLGTRGTIASQSYILETNKIAPDITVVSKACPMWVPLVENGEAQGDGADYFVEKYIGELLAADSLIDTIVLGCTHYPLLIDKIRKYTPSHINVVEQGPVVAASLADYLMRHNEIESLLSRCGTVKYLTTENAASFDAAAKVFTGGDVKSTTVTL